MYFAAVAIVGTALGQPALVPNNDTIPVFQDHRFYRERQIKLPIKYEKARNTIRQVMLYVSRNGENTWYLVAAQPPDRDFFIYTAPEDGIYWFTIVDEDLQGRREPADITKTHPDCKVIVDTVKPHIQFTQTNRSADSVHLEWVVDDKFPDDNSTRVHFKTLRSPETAWQEIPLPTASKTGVTFPANTSEPIVVRVTTYDVARNKTEEYKQFPALSSSQISTSLASPIPTPGVSPATGSPQNTAIIPPSPVIAPAVNNQPNYPAMPAVNPAPDAFAPIVPSAPPNLPASPPGTPLPVSPLSPPPPEKPLTTSATQENSTIGLTLTPQPLVSTAPQTPSQAPNTYGTQAGGIVSPSVPAGPLGPINPVSAPTNPASTAVVPASPIVPVAPFAPPTPVPTMTSGIGSSTSNSLSGTALPTFDPRQTAVSTVSSGTGSFEPSRKFDSAVVTTGTSGFGGNVVAALPVLTGSPTAAPIAEVARANVISYLAFDMSYEVESRGPSGISRVDLWVTRDEGRSWWKWSQHDGKGGSIRVNLNVPANTQPEGTYGFRIVPVSGAGLSEREPSTGDVPDLRVVVDITPPQLELFPPISDPSNPDTLVIQWKAADKNFSDDPITIEWSEKPTGPWQPVATGSDTVQTVAGTTSTPRHLANTGQFSWRVPAGLSPRVYLKVSARDAAGNVREVITRDPILVDLIKPRAKISGIVAPSTPALSKQ
jgi:hypothetical protein